MTLLHDQLCEAGTLSAISGSFGPSKGCQCASRAYQRDPLPDDLTPIWPDAPSLKIGVPSAAPLIAALARQAS